MAYKDEELLLSVVLEELTIEQFEKIQDQIERNGAHIFTQNFEDKMYKLFSRNVNEFKAKQDHELVDVKEEINKGRKTILPGRYLLIAILIMLISSISVMAGPLQQKLKEIVYTLYKDYIVFEIDENEEDNKSSDEIVYFRPSYVPAGFEIIEESIEEAFEKVFMMWVNEDQMVYYEQRTTKYGEMVLSSETVPIDIQFDDISAKLIEESDGFNIIFYEDEGKIFMIAGHLDKSELIKMLSSLEAIDIAVD